MQGSNARKTIVIGLCVGLAGVTGCQNMRGKIPAPKLAMPQISMPQVKMPNLMAWRDKDKSAVLSSAEQPAADPTTPAMNATPYAAYGATGSSRPAISQGISPASYPATPYPSVPPPGSPAGSGSRNNSVPQTPNYQVGPYGVTRPPQASATSVANGAGGTPSPHSRVPAAVHRDATPPGSCCATPQNRSTGTWGSLSAPPQEAPSASEQRPLNTAPASQWDHLDPASAPQAYHPPDPSSAEKTLASTAETFASPDRSGSPDSPAVATAPVSSSPEPVTATISHSENPAIAAAHWEQPSAPAPTILSNDSLSPPATISQVSHSDSTGDDTERPDMKSYSDHIAAQAAMPWRPGSTDSYAQTAAANLRGEIRSDADTVAETPAGSSQVGGGGNWPATP